MPSITVTHRQPGERLRQRLATPRDDVLVRERAADGTAAAETTAADVNPTDITVHGAHDEVDRPPGVFSRRFVAEDGPFRTYTRSLTNSPDGHDVVEHIDFRLDIPLLGRLGERAIAAGIRRHLLDKPGSPLAAWWAPPVRLRAEHVSLLGAACLAAIVIGYPLGLLSQAGPYLAADFGSSSGELADAQATVRLLAGVGLIAYPFADRVGRRLVALVLAVVALATSFVGAFAPSLGWVTLNQGVARAAATAAAIIVPIVVAEELPAGARAWATGIQAMATALGVGMVLWFIPLNDLGPGMWRAQFAAAIVGIAVVNRLRRTLPESRRYMMYRHASARDTARVAPRIDRTRVVLLAGSVLFLNAFVGPISNLQNDFLRTERHLSATAVSLFLLATNTPGGIGVLAGGRLCDRRGHHRVIALAIGGSVIANTLMFATDGATMALMSLVGSVLGGAAVPAVGTLWQELFPTARRGAASGILAGAGLIGSFGGLWFASRNLDSHGYSWVFTALAVCPLASVVVLLRLPETAAVPLEVLNEGELAPSE